MQGVLAVGTALAVLALPGAAMAATAEVTISTAEEGDLVELSYSAAAGETNNLTIRQLPSNALRLAIRDTGAAITPSTGCRAVSPNEVICDAPTGSFDNSIFVTLKDGNDRADASGFTQKKIAFNIYGGAGSDTIVGSASNRNVLSGDDLSTESAPDTIFGGPDDDYIEPGGGNDVVDGRRGRDSIVLRDESGPVTIDLVRGFAQAPSGRDSLRSMEDGEGGDGPDTLLGTAGRNFFRGNGGRDRIVGRDGNDRIEGGDARDSVFGGNGHDRLAGGGGDDSVFGGKGDDKLFGQGGRDALSAGPGADRVVSVDKLRDRVNCGRGRRDRVKANRFDRVRGCERVARR